MMTELSMPILELLTAREREIVSLVAAGITNKQAARRLGISPRTVEVHRARGMKKLGARNSADLVRIVLTGNCAKVAIDGLSPSELTTHMRDLVPDYIGLRSDP